MLNLSEELYMTKGCHKKCYCHPEDRNKCIKIPYNEGGKLDLEREFSYVKILQRKKKDYSMWPKFYGVVTTNLGDGYVYERVVNFDGSPCKTLEDFLKDEHLLAEHFDVLVVKLRQLKSYLLDNEIITMAIFPENIIIQMGRHNDISLRVVNDMGSAALIPLEYYFSFVAKIRVRKIWGRFCKHIMEGYHLEAIQRLAKAIA